MFDRNWEPAEATILETQWPKPRADGGSRVPDRFVAEVRTAGAPPFRTTKGVMLSAKDGFVAKASDGSPPAPAAAGGLESIFARVREAQAMASGGAAAPEDPIALLTKLTALRDQGVLTAEEFEAQKRRILG